MEKAKINESCFSMQLKYMVIILVTIMICHHGVSANDLSQIDLTQSIGKKVSDLLEEIGDNYIGISPNIYLPNKLIGCYISLPNKVELLVYATMVEIPADSIRAKEYLINIIKDQRIEWIKINIYEIEKDKIMPCDSLSGPEKHRRGFLDYSFFRYKSVGELLDDMDRDYSKFYVAYPGQVLVFNFPGDIEISIYFADMFKHEDYMYSESIDMNSVRAEIVTSLIIEIGTDAFREKHSLLKKK